MRELIDELRNNHSQFDVLWNKMGTEIQEHMVKNAPGLLQALGLWYNKSNELMFELQEKIDEAEVLLEAIREDDEDAEDAAL